MSTSSPKLSTTRKLTAARKGILPADAKALKEARAQLRAIRKCRALLDRMELPGARLTDLRAEFFKAFART